MLRPGVALLVLLAGCGGAASPTDGGRADAGERDGGIEVDAGEPGLDAPEASDDGSSAMPDGTAGEDLAAHRERLLLTLGPSCSTWASWDASQRAVFLTITHRLFTSRLADGTSMLAHVVRLYAVLGGGSSGTTCGGSDNNRVFLGTDDTLHARLVETWNDTTPIDDGAGATWIHTRDVAGPHDPFDASAETDTGLRCTLIFEGSDSRPPTAQAHYFEGPPVAFDRGDASLPADPFLLEIDQDYNCVHDSNPTCDDFEDRYRENHGDFFCDWVPSACTASGTGCYRDVSP